MIASRFYIPTELIKLTNIIPDEKRRAIHKVNGIPLIFQKYVIFLSLNLSELNHNNNIPCKI